MTTDRLNTDVRRAARGSRRRHATTSGRGRRGTILIFALGVMTLLSLIGIGLLANVRGQQRRVELARQAAVRPSLMDQAIEIVRQRLHADLWDGVEYLSDDSNTPPADARERNEPFDAPGPFDRWLASTLPYVADVPTFNSSLPLERALVWPRVSYLGSDVVNNSAVIPGMVDFQWLYQSRALTPLTPFFTPAYGEDQGSFNSYFPAASIRGVPVVMTPPDYGTTLGFAPPTLRIPGATTNVTIADARREWESSGLASAARFPYFDTNMDGVLDLYDADGDGVPDSPISFVLPYPKRRPSDPNEVYAVIRIIDNASMVNVNTAMALDTDGNGIYNPPADFFSEVNSNLQLRGRRVCEVTMDAPLREIDGNYEPVRVADQAVGANPPNLVNLLAYRFNGRPYLPTVVDGPSYYTDVVRRLLIGGMGVLAPYRIFDIVDEVALRHRFSRLPTGPPTSLEGFLNFTLRINSFVERFADAADWLGSLDSDSVPPLIRRPLFTTMSYDSTRRPHTNANLNAPPGRMLIRNGAASPLLMPANAHPEKVDLNPVWLGVGSPTIGDLAGYASRLASAIYAAGQRYSLTIDGAVFDLDELADLSWQLAVNLLDYMDSDDTPTVIADTSLTPVPPIEKVQYVGLEAQPFISKYGARFVWDVDDDEDGDCDELVDRRRFAVEIINPYTRPMGAFDGDYKLLVYSNGTGSPTVTAYDLPVIPAADDPDPPSTPLRRDYGRLVYMNQPDEIDFESWLPNPPPAEWVNNAFEFSSNDHIVLTRTINVDGEMVNWPVDAVRVPPSIDGPPACGQCIQTRSQRDESRWRFTSARGHLESGAGPIGYLELTGSANFSSTVSGLAPSHWVFRNNGLLARNLDSPGELSRVLAIGTRRREAPDGTPMPHDTGYAFVTPPEYLFDKQSSSPEINAGRLDFARERDARAIFAALTCDALSTDGLDNNGDGSIDELGEAAAVAYRVAGRINVNTAPAVVLRSAPWMFNNVGGWDLAAAIVAHREGRNVPSLLVLPPSPPTMFSAGPGESFRSVAELMKVRGSGASSDVQRFFESISSISDHSADLNSPDFDRHADGIREFLRDIRLRDLPLARWANILTTRSDVFTVYVVLIDDQGRYLARSQFTLDRSVCAAEDTTTRRPVLPRVLGRKDTSYYDNTR
jgi:hypothetical protein